MLSGGIRFDWSIDIKVGPRLVGLGWMMTKTLKPVLSEGRTHSFRIKNILIS